MDPALPGSGAAVLIMVAKVIQSWARYWTSLSRYGITIPRTYLVFDTETGGGRPHTYRVYQIGACVVHDGEIVDTMGAVLRHPPETYENPCALEVNGLTWDVRSRSGIDPRQGYEMFHRLFSDWRDRGGLFVAHKGEFDLGMLRADFLDYLGIEFDLGQNQLLDTGALVKGAQMGVRPMAGEPVRSFCRRVVNAFAPGVKWSLDKYCFEAFNLARFGLDKALAHGAPYDCQITHYLMRAIDEMIHEIGDAGDEDPSSSPSPTDRGVAWS